MPLTTPTIRIILAPDRIRFHDGAEEWNHAPVVWYDPGAGKTVGIGDTPVPGAERLTLFGREPLPAGLDRNRLLAGFFMKGLESAVRKVFLKTRPKVTVEGIDTLFPLLAGYERGVVKGALIEGGAMTVEFA